MYVDLTSLTFKPTFLSAFIKPISIYLYLETLQPPLMGRRYTKPSREFTTTSSTEFNVPARRYPNSP
ncbi:unnamed protein product [Lactuca virosa]|uniref:Uncharacterized protein n=1 Tax=Lactuca virosa TaxID=75947 RepID=A0AAU9MCL0_9ASTR|nr:unnamed protein product [Lactuca virosa]